MELTGKYIVNYPFLIPLGIGCFVLGITFIWIGVYLVGMKLGWWYL